MDNTLEEYLKILLTLNLLQMLLGNMEAQSVRHLFLTSLAVMEVSFHLNRLLDIVANNPPQILDKNGNFYAYLTKNIVKTPRIDPDELKSALNIQ